MNKIHTISVLKVFPNYMGMMPENHKILFSYVRCKKTWVASYHDQTGNMIGNPVCAKTKNDAVTCIKNVHGIN